MDIPYNFYVEGIGDLNELLLARGFKMEEELPFGEPDKEYSWVKETNRKRYSLTIDKVIFENEGKLKFIKKTDWDDDWVNFSVDEIAPKDDDDDLPF